LTQGTACLYRSYVWNWNPNGRNHTMRMINGFEVIAESWQGDQDGHVPGRNYRGVEVAIGKRGNRYRAVIIETWGSAQGYDEKHGRFKFVGRADNWREALEKATRFGRDLDFNASYLAQALSDVEDQMEDQMEESTSWQSSTVQDEIDRQEDIGSIQLPRDPAGASVRIWAAVRDKPVTP
jgi:hypothetical protein